MCAPWSKCFAPLILVSMLVAGDCSTRLHSRVGVLPSTGDALLVAAPLGLQGHKDELGVPIESFGTRHILQKSKSGKSGKSADETNDGKEPAEENDADDDDGSKVESDETKSEDMEAPALAPAQGPAELPADKENTLTKNKKPSVKKGDVDVENGEAPAKKGKSSARKKKTSPSDCSWNDEDKSCSILEGPFMKILSRGRSKSGKLFFQQYVCSGYGRNACNKDKNCKWSGSCDSKEYLRTQRKCFGSGSPFIKHLDGSCARKTDTSSCSSSDGCQWDSVLQSCGVDLVGAFTGSSGDDKRIAELKAARTEELQQQFNFNAGAFVLNPDSILSWKLPKFNCPKGTKKAICDFVKLFDDEFRYDVHCGVKFDINDITECNDDNLCLIGTDGACGISPFKLLEIEAKGYQILAKSTKSPLASAYMNLLSTCASSSQVECGDGCVFEGGACHVDIDSFIERQVLTKKSFTRSECKGFPLVHNEKGCEDIVDEEICRANAECTFNDGTGCTPDKRETVLAALMEIERPVSKAVEASRLKCASFNKKSECEAPKVL